MRYQLLKARAKKQKFIKRTKQIKEDSDDSDLLAAAEAMESISEKEEVVEEVKSEEVKSEEVSVEETPADDSKETEAALMKLKKDELVEKAKAAGVATSGTKADIVARLLE